MPAPITTHLAFVGKSLTLVLFAWDFHFEITLEVLLDNEVQTYSVIPLALPPWGLV